ncbi:MAG: hypothetical protein WAQ98_06905 [Blastocatellia bacterium]
MITLFSLFAEIERDLISLRTREALAAAKVCGKQLGRPKGSLGKFKLDGKEQQIKEFLSLKISKSLLLNLLVLIVLLSIISLFLGSLLKHYRFCLSWFFYI